MVLMCNICDKNIETSSHYIFDKIHCSIKCKNIYKKIMEEKNLGKNELYYERNYSNIKRRVNSYPIISDKYLLKKKSLPNLKKNDLKLIETMKKENILNFEEKSNQNSNQEILYNNKINNKINNYFNFIYNIFFKIFKYFTK